MRSLVPHIASMALLALTASAHAQETRPDMQACTDDPATSLLATHERARQAHLEGSAQILADISAEQVISAQKGKITVSTRAEVLDRFTRYFGSVEYHEWSDVEPPRLRFSEDGRMGWMAVRILGVVRPRGGDDSAWERFHSSWVATYEREGCVWKMTAIASEVVPVDQ